MSIGVLLVLFVEGMDDARFAESVIAPALQSRFLHISIVEYAVRPPVWLDRFIRSLEAQGASYLLLRDMDDAPCITAKKDEWIEKVPHLARDRMVVVRRQIEGWYQAGLSARRCGELGVPHLADTTRIRKTDFDASVPRRFKSRIDYMVEILSGYSIEVATKQNGSMAYLVERHLGLANV